MNKKVVLITGSSNGLGKTIAKEFAKESYAVVINYNNSKDNALDLEEELSKITDCISVKADVSDEQEVKEMVKKIANKYGKIDVVVNNAAIANDMPFENRTKEDFLKTLEVNLIGPFLVSKYASKYMTENSSIINVSSNNAIDSYYPESIDYDASKAGLISLTHNLAKQFPKIRVNAVAPGWIKDTKMNEGLTQRQIKDEESKIILNRFGSKKEISNVILFLASDKASYINDSIIKVDGGIK